MTCKGGRLAWFFFGLEGLSSVPRDTYRYMSHSTEDTLMNVWAHSWRRIAGVVLIGLLLAGSTIFSSSDRQQNANSLLTGRWLVSVEGAPNAHRYVEFSPNGNVTAYKLDGVTIDMVPGWREKWTVRGDVIECTAELHAPTKPLLATIRDLARRTFASQRQPQPEPTRFSYMIENASTLHLELLDSPTLHSVTLNKVSKADE